MLICMIIAWDKSRRGERKENSNQKGVQRLMEEEKTLHLFREGGMVWWSSHWSSRKK